MKRFLIQANDEAKAGQIVDAFLRERSLYKVRSVFRGFMGLPRMRSVDRYESLHSFGNKGTKTPKHNLQLNSVNAGAENK